MLHDDWELQGDGGGDINKLMFEPAKKVLDVCDLWGAKYTFFAEFGQQLAMLNSPHKTHQKHAAEWESILQDAINRGHDVQLHFHPQWINATFTNNKWQLDFSKWAMSKLSEEEVDVWINKGVNYLSGLFSKTNQDYKTVAFRAGSWMNQPSGKIIKALKKHEVIADVTVIKGLVLKNSELGAIDFSYAPSNLLPWYSDENDFCQIGNKENGVICIPTYSKHIVIPSLLNEVFNNPLAAKYLCRRRYKKKSNDYTPVYHKKESKKKQSLFFKRRRMSLDFGSTHYSTILKQVSHVIKYMVKEDVSTLPMVLLSHSKSFYSYSNFHNLLQKLDREACVEYTTTQHAVEVIKNTTYILSENNV
jgi:hypothetical protein